MRLIFITVLLLSLSACALTPTPKIENANEAIGFAYIEITNIAKQVELQRQSGGLSDDRALEIKAQLQDAIQAVTFGEALLCISARTLTCVPDEEAAMSKANTAITITRGIRRAIK